MNAVPPFLATAIGSFPYSDADKALDLIFASIPDAPVWPQLPRLGLTEQMEIQYSEGMPRATIEQGRDKLYFDTSGDYSEEFAAFYETYMAAMEEGDAAAFERLAITPAYSKGIYAMEARLKARGAKLPFVKVHTTGPCSFTLTTTDENKRALYYNEEFRDVAAKGLALKSRWQIRKFAPYAERIICFIDEPILSAFGSSTYIGVKRDDVVALVAEAVDAVHAENAVAGVHCCGNTDWSILIDAGVDMVNFDAYGYGETITLYPAPVKSFIERGGTLAFGIVPTADIVNNETADSLAERYVKLVDAIAAATGLDKKAVYRQTALTPSCGTGSLPVETAEKVFAVLPAVAAILKKAL